MGFIGTKGSLKKREYTELPEAQLFYPDHHGYKVQNDLVLFSRLLATSLVWRRELYNTTLESFDGALEEICCERNMKATIATHFIFYKTTFLGHHP